MRHKTSNLSSNLQCHCLGSSRWGILTGLHLFLHLAFSPSLLDRTAVREGIFSLRSLCPQLFPEMVGTLWMFMEKISKYEDHTCYPSSPLRSYFTPYTVMEDKEPLLGCSGRDWTRPHWLSSQCLGSPCALSFSTCSLNTQIPNKGMSSEQGEAQGERRGTKRAQQYPKVSM